MSTTNCALCRGQVKFEPPVSDRRRTFSCQRCGQYIIDGTTLAILENGPKLNVGAVSGWVRRQNLMGVTPTINDPIK
jgi:hypothetical protein